MADELELSRRPLAVKLTWWNRVILDVLGLAGLGAGAAAVFITHLEAGPVALIAAGLLLLLIGLGGHMPSRLKVGDNEAQWEIEREAVQVFVERVAEDTPAERQPELLDALEDLAESAPQVAAAGISAVAYEGFVRDAIKEAIDDLHDVLPKVAPKFATSVEQGVKAIITAPDMSFVAVEVKFSGKSLSVAHVERDYRFLTGESSAGVKALLIVTKTPLTRLAARRVDELPDMYHVVVDGPQDKAVLVGAIREVLRIKDRQ